MLLRKGQTRTGGMHLRRPPHVRKKIKTFVVRLASSRSRVLCCVPNKCCRNEPEDATGTFLPHEPSCGREVLSASEPLVSIDVGSAFLTEVMMSYGDS